MIGIHRPPQSAKIININRSCNPVNSPQAAERKPIVKFLDIKARGQYPLNILSNFSKTDFKLDGVRIKSLEGFLQSLKINNPDKQRQMCLLNGFDAKKMSKSIKQSEYDMLLYWNGKTYLNGSEEYKALKKSVIEASKNIKSGYFEFEGRKITSINAFLTAIKLNSKVTQDVILQMTPENLKEISKSIVPTYQIRDLFWNGKVIKRDSKEYQQLLDRAYNQRYESDYMFRKALKDTKGYRLLHSRGKSDMTDTVLTQDEFLSRLNRLRDAKNTKFQLMDFVLAPYYWVKNHIQKFFDKNNLQ